ncbi:hypothetical protein SPACI_056750 [Sporomusa acidovorans DSM 3132]|uniref:Uncharacterized protein n=1 Tax=Sporomusa acidovorans (strain ATCC 49682 / DSM 3132 / Mol) TaxID=1123286 RepID=A0ABZ3JBX8_SPOA4|nr:hypothetical protein SPACI_12680 [Sporomusa acidovorans DSM 3132]SDE79781.1 hypothetical protein SAMN04488499_1021100 [Sporomusa acidovorans]
MARCIEPGQTIVGIQLVFYIYQSDKYKHSLPNDTTIAMRRGLHMVFGK